MKTSLIEFFSSDSGIVAEKTGFSFGWVLVAILAVGVIFGSIEPVPAHDNCPSNEGCGAWHGHGNCCGVLSTKYMMRRCCKDIVGGLATFSYETDCRGGGC